MLVLSTIGMALMLLLCFVPRDPNQCNFIGALIGGAVSLFGANKKRKAEQAHIADQNWRNSPEGIRALSEAAGFNPLVFAGPGAGFGSNYQPTFGNGIAEAGQLIAEGYNAEQQLKIQRAELELDNRRLEQLAKNATLKANVPGIYGNGGTRGTGRKLSGGTPASDISENPLRDARADGVGSPSNYNPVTAPAFTLFGVPFYGSGQYSTGETYEDALGDNPFSWTFSPAIFGDAVGHTFGNWVSRKSGDHLMDEWFRRERERDPYPKKSKPKTTSRTEEYQRHMLQAYPTVFD